MNRTRTLALVATLWLSQWTQPAIAYDAVDEPACRHSVDVFVDYLRAKDLPDNGNMQRIIDSWQSPACAYDVNGYPRMSRLSRALTAFLASQPDWGLSLQAVEAVERKYPGSALAVVTRAEYWFRYAMAARGSGYSNTVDKEAWGLFRERMLKAEQVLTQGKAVASVLPNWYSKMVAVQKLLERSREQRMQTFMEGADRFPHYVPLYTNMENFIEPKWGGSWEEVEQFALWAVNHTQPSLGREMYARVYWQAVEEGGAWGGNLFKLTRAQWPSVKQGFEDMMKRSPKSSLNLNRFAMLACQAGDKGTYLSVRKRIGKAIEPDTWQPNYSVDLCDLKFGYSKPLR